MKEDEKILPEEIIFGQIIYPPSPFK